MNAMAYGIIEALGTWEMLNAPDTNGSLLHVVFKLALLVIPQQP